MSSKEIHDIVKEIDYMDNQKINYSEFLAATINTAEFLTDQKLLAIFKTFDFDNTGEITTQNLKDAFSKFGKEISDQEVKIIMQQHDADGGKTISFDEFKAMMLGH